ncbi:MAG: hypothetical protein Q9181_005988 [Wetmoreana brouardii]
MASSDQGHQNQAAKKRTADHVDAEAPGRSPRDTSESLKRSADIADDATVEEQLSSTGTGIDGSHSSEVVSGYDDDPQPQSPVPTAMGVKEAVVSREEEIHVVAKVFKMNKQEERLPILKPTQKPITDWDLEDQSMWTHGRVYPQRPLEGEAVDDRPRAF